MAKKWRTRSYRARRHWQSYIHPYQDMKETPTCNTHAFTTTNRWDGERDPYRMACWKIGVALRNRLRRIGYPYTVGGPDHGRNDGNNCFTFHLKRKTSWLVTIRRAERGEGVYQITVTGGYRTFPRAYNIPNDVRRKPLPDFIHAPFILPGGAVIEKNQAGPGDGWIWTDETHEAVIDSVLDGMLKAAKCLTANPRGTYGFCKSCDRQLQCLAEHM